MNIPQKIYIYNATQIVLIDVDVSFLNLVPFLIEVAEQGGTVGEIVEVMKKVYGEWEESFGI